MEVDNYEVAQNDYHGLFDILVKVGKEEENQFF